MQRAIVALVGDLHINSTTALTQPQFNLDDGGTFSSSELQRHIWRHWLRFWERVGERKEELKWPVVVVINGEIADNLKHPSTQLITRNVNDLFRNSIETLKPALDLADHIIVTRGTEAHSGNSGWMDEKIAEDLGAIPSRKGKNPIYSHFQFIGSIAGVRFHIQHHAPTSYTVRRLKVSAAARAADRMMERYAAINQPYPDLCVFSHTHREFDSGDLYRMRAINLPSWQMTNAFGQRLGGDFLDIGGAIALCDRGQFTIEKVYRNIYADIVKPQRI